MIQFHNLFPTSIYHRKMEAYQEWNDVLLTKKEYMFDPDENNHLTGESRGKVFLHKDEDLLPFFTDVSEAIEDMLYRMEVRTEMFYPYFMKSWFTIMSGGSQMKAHAHDCADISFVYYVDPPKDTSICFQVEKSNNSYFSGIFHHKDEYRTHVRGYNALNSMVNAVPVESGDLIAFPSWMKHYVVDSPDTSVRVRSVAGDVKLMLNPDYEDLETGLIHYTHWRKFK